MIIFKRDEVLYLVGRALALLARPICLLLGNWLFGNAVATILASAFLVTAVLNILFGVDPHRPFYTRRFGSVPVDATRAFTRYFFAHILLGGAGMAACILYFRTVEQSTPLAILAGLFFLTERLADETLRFTLFQRQRGRWGRFMIERVMVQAVGVGMIMVIRPASGAPVWILLALTAGNLASFGRMLPGNLVLRCLRKPARIWSYVRSAALLIGRSGTIWLLSLAMAFGSYLERLIVLASRKDDLAIFSLIVTSLSVVQIGVDYFYFSQRRREFLEGAIDFRRALLSRTFGLVILGTLLSGSALMMVNVHLYKGAPHISWLAVVLVAIMQVTIASISIAREIAYWHNQLRAILRVEMIFFASVVAIFALLYLVHLNYVWLLIPAAGALLLRLVLLARIPHERLPIS
jgi:hypothetical protein